MTTDTTSNTSMVKANQGVFSDPLFQILSSQQGSNFLSPASQQPIIPSNEELNALALISKFDNDDVIKDVAKKDLAFVRSAARLLNKDAFLRQQMGGSGFRSVLRLSGMMKLQFNDIMMKLRMAKMVPMMLEDLGFNTAESIAYVTGTGGDLLRGTTKESITGLTKAVAKQAIIDKEDPVSNIGKALKKSFFSDDTMAQNLALGPRTALANAFAGSVEDGNAGLAYAASQFLF